MSEKTPAGQMPATDSADEIRDLVGDDSTATFESDPKFVEPTPGKEGSSENLQDRKDRQEVQHEPSLKLRDIDDVEDSDEEIAEADDLDAEDEEDDEVLEDDDVDEDAEDDAEDAPVMRAAAADEDDDDLEDDDDEDFEDDDDDFEDDDEEDDDEDDAEYEDDDDEDDEDDVIDASSGRQPALKARTTDDGRDTEEPRDSEADPEIDEDPQRSDSVVAEYNTDGMADKALGMASRQLSADISVAAARL